MPNFERNIYRWMDENENWMLRVAMGIVFIWFGALKPLGLSPAADLVAQTTFWIPIDNFNNVLGFWEILIGVSFMYKPLLRLALILLAFHMPGTALPFIILPEQTFASFPFVLTLEGQYIVKNLVLVAAAIAIGARMYMREQRNLETA